MSADGFLARWSRRKRQAAEGGTPEPPEVRPPAATPAEGAQPAPSADPAAPAELPPVESLTAESDFTPFMAKEVDPELKRTALKTLFRDERFNVMDGLDVYIDDYTKPAPIPAEWYGRMAQLAGLGDVPGREAAERERASALARESAAQQPAQAPATDVALEPPALDANAAGIAQPDDFTDVRDEGEARSRQ